MLYSSHYYYYSHWIIFLKEMVTYLYILWFKCQIKWNLIKENVGLFKQRISYFIQGRQWRLTWVSMRRGFLLKITKNTHVNATRRIYLLTFCPFWVPGTEQICYFQCRSTNERASLIYQVTERFLLDFRIHPREIESYFNFEIRDPVIKDLLVPRLLLTKNFNIHEYK